MIRKATISISEPCHENWQNMSPTDKGRFCDACQKNVIDFTRISDREILAKINSGGKLCGRFLPSQLDREIITPKEKSPIWILASALAFLGLAQNAYSQEKPSTVQTDAKADEERLVQEQMAAEQGNTVTGKVSDNIGGLPGANVVVKGTTRSIQADFDGNFSIAANKNEVLVFSFVGMISKEHKIIDTRKKLDITLGEGAKVGEMVVNSKRTYPGHVLHKIGNWFRRPENKRY
jgi:hypothetical protein